MSGSDRLLFLTLISLFCWGGNDFGQATPPGSVDGTTGTASAIAAHTFHSLAIQVVPLLVTLESFTAVVERHSVRLNWNTTAEIDNVGFRVLRAREPQAQRPGGDGAAPPAEDVQLEIVEPFIPAMGNELTGASYEYVDTTVRRRPGALLYYLEDIDIYGHATRHGPVRVTTPWRVQEMKPSR